MSSRSNGILSCSVSFPVLKREEAFFPATKNIKDLRSLLLNATWSFYVFSCISKTTKGVSAVACFREQVWIKFAALLRTVALREPEIVLRVRRRLAEASHLSPASDAANLSAVLSNEPVTVLDLLHTLPKTDKHQQLWVEVMIWLMVVNVVFLPVFVSLLFLLFMVFMPFLHLPNSTRLRLSNPCAAEVCNC